MSATLKEEIQEAILKLKIERKIKVYLRHHKDEMLNQLKFYFVNGNPRVWWLSLKYKPIAFTFEDEHVYERIKDFFNPNEVVWFIVEGDNDKLLLYQTTIENIILIISECSFFEYYLISLDYKKFLCENDHNEFLFINLEPSLIN